MANTIPTAFMNLPNPVPGIDPGPDYANNIYSSLVIIDQHDHTPGSGQAITPNGININANLPFQGNNATLLRSVRFSPQGAPLAGATPDLGCLYEAGVDLYYNDGNGNQVRITQSGSVAGASGTITGLPSGTASASYVSASGTFVFQQATSTAANLDIGTVILRYPGSYPTPAGNFIALEAPASLATGFAFTLPNNTPPVSGSAIVSDTSGVLSYVDPKEFMNPPGSIIAFGGTSAPLGWLMCDGAAYLNSTYPTLFAAIGSAYGAPDAFNFNVPDFRGIFLRGVSGPTGNDPDAAARTAFAPGGNSGNNVGSLQFYGYQSHNHGISDPSHQHRASQTGGIYSALSAGAPVNLPGGGGTSLSDMNGIFTSPELTGIAVLNNGGNETRPLNVYVNYIIKI